MGDVGGLDSGGAGPSEGGDLALNMPRKSAHDVYLIHAMNTLSKFNQIVFTMNSFIDPRIVPYTRQCIIEVVDDKIRDQLLAALKYAIEYVKTTTDKDPSEKGELIMEVCQNALAQAYSYFDEYIGLSKVNALIPLTTIPQQEEVAAAQAILAADGDLPEEPIEPKSETAMISSTDHLKAPDGA